MQPCIGGILAKIRPKIRALLRLRHLYSTAAMLNQYKCHIWGLKEYSNGAIIIAPISQLKRLDKVQRWYLHELGLTDRDAFVNHNFAPPSLRRCIGMLRFLHKRVLRKCHPGVMAILPSVRSDVRADCSSKAFHSFGDMDSFQIRLWQRSLFADVHI